MTTQTSPGDGLNGPRPSQIVQGLRNRRERNAQLRERGEVTVDWDERIANLRAMLDEVEK